VNEEALAQLGAVATKRKEVKIWELCSIVFDFFNFISITSYFFGLPSQNRRDLGPSGILCSV